MLANLLNNATKYTLDGGTITLTVHNDGSRILVDVEDNGVGIEAGLLPHIFDLFTQASRTPDRSVILPSALAEQT